MTRALFLWRHVRPALAPLEGLLFLYNKRRLRRYGYGVADALPPMDAATRRRCDDPGCARFALEVYNDLAKFIAPAEPTSLSGLFRPTIHALRLADFPTMSDYETTVKRHKRGYDLRMVKKARRAGFYCRLVGRGAYARDLLEIMTSMPIRSGGVVERPKACDDSNDDVPHAPPVCPEHWMQTWGVFVEQDGREKLVGRTELIRAGNLVEVGFFMGHGDFLRVGVMKLLHFDIMTWLLAREDLSVEGVEYLCYGGVEVGLEGRFNWKRYLEFRPFALRLAPPNDFASVPAGFKERVYLKLNPDVKAAGMNARMHYLLHGKSEGRPFRRQRRLNAGSAR